MILKDTSPAAGNWENPEPGMYAGVCVDVVDKGWVESNYKGETKQQHKVRLVWEIDQKTSEGHPMLVGKTVTFSCAKKAKLRDILRSWRGKDLSAQELAEGFDLEKVIGAQASVIINEFTNEHGDNIVYVDNVMRPANGQKVTPSDEYKRVRDRDDYVAPLQPTESAEKVEDDTADDVPF